MEVGVSRDAGCQPGLSVRRATRGRVLGGRPPVVSAQLGEVRSLRTRTATPPAPGRLSGVRVTGRVRLEIGLLSGSCSPRHPSRSVYEPLGSPRRLDGGGEGNEDLIRLVC